MAFTYTEGSTTTHNRVRLEIGDVDSTRPLFSDAEIDDIIAVETDVLPSAARACEVLATRFARDYDFSADGASFHKSSIAKMYSEMARKLRVRAWGSTTVQMKRKDAYSDSVTSEKATIGGASLDFDRGRWQE